MKLNFLYPMEENLWATWVDFVNHWFTDKYVNGLDELAIIIPKVGADISALDPSRNSVLKEIYLAWCHIKTSLPGTHLRSWRVIYKYGEEIAPGLNVFRLRDGSSMRYFWLSSEDDFLAMQARLTDLFPKISAYWHIQQGRGIFHAAGIIHKEKAYLFIGPSGAGKSTVSALSMDQGDRIIHDDHIVIFKEKSEQWLVSDASHSIQGIPIKALIFLVQDRADQLFPIDTARSVKGLMKSLHEHGKYVLFGEALKRAFATTAEIARQVPGFELRFRKSADFWKLIDERFSD